MRVFIVCPVRNVDRVTNELIRHYVATLEKKGHQVYWPYRDTDQSDSNGMAICTANREAIYAADEVHIWFDCNSQGSIFDIGMTFAYLRDMHKKVVLINKGSVASTPHKSFNNILLSLTA